MKKSLKDNISRHVQQSRTPYFREMVAINNTKAALATALFAVIIGIAGLLGTQANQATTPVITYGPFNYIYILLIVCNIPALFLSLYAIRKDSWTHAALIENLVFIHILLNMVLGCATIFSTQTGSSFYFETVLIISPLAMLPVYRLGQLCLTFIGGIVLLIVFVTRAGIYLGWQDHYDIYLFFAFCFFIALSRRRWFRSQYEASVSLRDMNEKLYKESRTDELTGLCNRTALAEDFNKIIGHEVCVAMVDFDHFKEINDTKGHFAGDQVLKSCADILREVFRQGDGVCYRFGGDEFLILAKEKDPVSFRAKLCEVQEKVREISQSVTIGYCCGHVSTEKEVESCIALADKNLYIQKNERKGDILGSGFGSA